jgi:hypothetical protein
VDEVQRVVGWMDVRHADVVMPLMVFVPFSSGQYDTERMFMARSYRYFFLSQLPLATLIVFPCVPLLGLFGFVRLPARIKMTEAMTLSNLGWQKLFSNGESAYPLWNGKSGHYNGLPNSNVLPTYQR